MVTLSTPPSLRATSPILGEELALRLRGRVGAGTGAYLRGRVGTVMGAVVFRKKK